MGRTPRNTAPIAGAASTFAYSSQDLSSALHTLHARSNKGDNNFEIIAVASSIAGVVVAILGLILGYIYWKRGPRNTSPASIQLEPLSSDNSPNPRTGTSPNPSTLNSCPTIPVNPSPDTSPTPVSVNISFNYNGTSFPFPYALDPSNPPMLCVEGSRTVTAPIEPAVRDGGGPIAKVEAITV